MIVKKKPRTQMPLTEDAKKKLAEILKPYSQAERVKIIRLAAINAELKKRKQAEKAKG